MIQEETGILRSGVRGDGGETKAGVTGGTGSAELRDQQAARQPLPLCVPQTQKQMNSCPCHPSAFMPSFRGWTPSPKAPKRTEAWGQGVGVEARNLRCKSPEQAALHTPQNLHREPRPRAERGLELLGKPPWVSAPRPRRRH